MGGGELSGWGAGVGQEWGRSVRGAGVGVGVGRGLEGGREWERGRSGMGAGGGRGGGLTGGPSRLLLGELRGEVKRPHLEEGTVMVEGGPRCII